MVKRCQWVSGVSLDSKRFIPFSFPKRTWLRGGLRGCLNFSSNSQSHNLIWMDVCSSNVVTWLSFTFALLPFAFAFACCLWCVVLVWSYTCLSPCARSFLLLLAIYLSVVDVSLDFLRFYYSHRRHYQCPLPFISASASSFLTSSSFPALVPEYTIGGEE